MDVHSLCAKLESLFPLDNCRDSWPHVQDHPAVCAQFKRRNMGLVLDFAPRIDRAATAVFPSPRVLAYLKDSGFRDGVLVTHHPTHWDVNAANVWSFPEPAALEFMRNQRIALYALHIPLDCDGPCATGRTFAAAIGVTVERTFFPYTPYTGRDVGVIGRSPADDLRQLSAVVASAVGHDVTTHFYHNGAVCRVAVVGGGVNVEAVDQAATLDVQALVTGISVVNAHSASAHQAAQRNGIAWIGVSHYSSERFACEALAVCLRSLGLPTSFCPDLPGLADMGDAPPLR